MMCVGVCAKTCHTSAAIGGVGGRLQLVGWAVGWVVVGGAWWVWAVGLFQVVGESDGAGMAVGAPTGRHCMWVVAARVSRVVVRGAARVPRVVVGGAARVPRIVLLVSCACELVRGGLVDGARIWAWGRAGLGRYYLIGQPQQ